MKTIDIITAQKVDINYTLAGVLQRVLAFIIDSVAIGLIYYLLAIFILAIFPNNWGVQDTYVYIVMLPIVLFYHLIFEYFMDGQSLGKKALGLRVIKANGERPEFIDYLTRWMFRVIDISFSFGIVAVVSILASEKRQRLGDIIGNTAVIQVQNPRNYTLSDVLNIMKLKNYEVTYSEAKLFNEMQMLLLKETLERYTKYPNDAHILAIKNLSLKMAAQLQIEEPKRKVEFLKILLRDYIYMTR